MTKMMAVVSLAAGLGLVGSAALAQSDGGAAADTDVTRGEGSLSQKLNATSGVIHPRQDVDPGIGKSAPRTEAMPVLRPPGTLGGNPDALPK